MATTSGEDRRRVGQRKQALTRGATGRPGRRTQDERSEEMRARLLEAAIKVLHERGYSGFRVAIVAETAGVSRGGQIHHFPTKEKLVAACLEHVFSEELERARREAAAAVDDDHVLDAARANAQQFFFSDDFIIAFDIILSGAKISRFSETIRSISQRTRIPAEQAWIDRYVATGIDRKDAEDILWLLWSVVRGLVVRREIGQDPAQFDRVMGLAVRLLSEHAERLRHG